VQAYNTSGEVSPYSNEVVYAVPAGSPSPNLPVPWQAQDVGNTGQIGSANYSSGVFTIAGAGSDIWGSADAFQFAYQSLAGNGEIVAHVTSLQDTNTHAKAGIMLRSTLAADSPHVILDVQPSGDIEFMSRNVSGDVTRWIAGTTHVAPVWLKLTRSGTTIAGFVSGDGVSWTLVGQTGITLTATVDAGLAVTSHSTPTLNTATFDNVSVTATSGDARPTSPPDVVIYASDVPAVNMHGAWSVASVAGAAANVVLMTPDSGVSNNANALSSPADYVDVAFNAQAGVPYTFWIRLRAAGNSKYADSLWVQFSDALAGGQAAYPLNSTSGLLVNLASDSTGASLQGWGWGHGAYWLQQPVTLTFAATGSHSMRLQIREDGAQFDQIVLSPSTYLTAPPGPAANDATIVPKP
jgi:regulation of enolase protein 1 (concanavalin A-like superfamily)